jgi:predicted nucleotidyltransferase
MGHNRAGDRRKRRLKRRRREEARLAVRPCTLEEFAAEYARTSRRKELFDKLTAEIDNFRTQTKQMKVYVFGSYLRRKREPGDVDLMVSYEPAGFPPQLTRMHPDDLQVLSVARIDLIKPVALASKEEMVHEFNTSKNNVRDGITIHPRQVHELTV